jgi:hypothetical protein
MASQRSLLYQKSFLALQPKKAIVLEGDLGGDLCFYLKMTTGFFAEIGINKFAKKRRRNKQIHPHMPAVWTPRGQNR